MTNEEIKQECEDMYAQIKQAQDRLVVLRSICKHENTFEGYYSWSERSWDWSQICSDCTKQIKRMPDPNPPPKATVVDLEQLKRDKLSQDRKDKIDQILSDLNENKIEL